MKACRYTHNVETKLRYSDQSTNNEWTKTTTKIARAQSKHQIHKLRDIFLRREKQETWTMWIIKWSINYILSATDREREKWIHSACHWRLCNLHGKLMINNYCLYVSKTMCNYLSVILWCWFIWIWKNWVFLFFAFPFWFFFLSTQFAVKAFKLEWLFLLCYVCVNNFDKFSRFNAFSIVFHRNRKCIKSYLIIRKIFCCCALCIIILSRAEHAVNVCRFDRVQLLNALNLQITSYCYYHVELKFNRVYSFLFFT